jgi:hypothetical protein
MVGAGTETVINSNGSATVWLAAGVLQIPSSVVMLYDQICQLRICNLLQSTNKNKIFNIKDFFANIFLIL